MTEPDNLLIEEFNTRRSEEAFAALVQQHINLVFGTAVRQVGDRGVAEEVTQNVFVTLAQNAGKLGGHPTIAGWLYQTTINKSKERLRSDLRRQRREHFAVSLEQANLEGASVWARLVPLLDEALLQLREQDRLAVVLHYMEGRTFGEVGSALGIGEDAARKRVDRCLDQLTVFFQKHGFMVPALTASAPLFALASHSAPSALAQTATAAALSKGATVLTLKGALKIMAWSKTKTTVAASVIAILAIGTAAVLINKGSPGPDIQGVWLGIAPLPGYGVHAGESPKTRMVLRITKTNGIYHVSGDSIDQGVKDVPIDVFTYKHGHVHAEVSAAHDSYDGTVNSDGTKITGKWKENNDTGALEIVRTTNPPPFPEPLTDDEYAPRAGSDLQGFWNGIIEAGKPGLAVNIKIAESADGTFRADFYCPPQGGGRQPASVTYDGKTVRLMPMAGYGMFEGELRNGGKEMVGHWIQNGGQAPTTFTLGK